MIFYIFCLLIIGVGTWCFIDDFKVEWKEQRKKKAPKNALWPSLIYGLKSFFAVAALAGLVLSAIFGLFFIGVQSFPGNEEKLVKTTSYAVADHSKMINDTSTLKFTSVEASGALEGVKITADKVIFENSESKLVEIRYFDQYYPWLAPWNLDTRIIATIK